MITPELVSRINELARKKRTTGLSQEETAEQTSTKSDSVVFAAGAEEAAEQGLSQSKVLRPTGGAAVQGPLRLPGDELLATHRVCHLLPGTVQFQALFFAFKTRQTLCPTYCGD